MEEIKPILRSDFPWNLKRQLPHLLEPLFHEEGKKGNGIKKNNQRNQTIENREIQEDNRAAKSNWKFFLESEANAREVNEIHPVCIYYTQDFTDSKYEIRKKGLKQYILFVYYTYAMMILYTLQLYKNKRLKSKYYSNLILGDKSINTNSCNTPLNKTSPLLAI